MTHLIRLLTHTSFLQGMGSWVPHSETKDSSQYPFASQKKWSPLSITAIETCALYPLTTVSQRFKRGGKGEPQINFFSNPFFMSGIIFFINRKDTCQHVGVRVSIISFVMAFEFDRCWLLEEGVCVRLTQVQGEPR